MRIHTDHLTLSNLYSREMYEWGVYIHVTEHGSRSHVRAFEVSLEGNGYRKNTGTSGAGDEYGATWDEWGVFLARLFDLDKDMVCGSVKNPVYNGVDDFDRQTDYRFVLGQMPEDTHRRHNWKFERVGVFACTKCTARRAR